MQWFSSMFGLHRRRPISRPVRSTGSTGHLSDLERALASGTRMLDTLTEAYGADSVITRQQHSYVATLRRELSAAKHAA